MLGFQALAQGPLGALAAPVGGPGAPGVGAGMPTYAQQADMVTRFTSVEMIQLTDRDSTANAIDASVMLQALLDADAEIDARLQARYSLPLPSVPRLLTNIACDLARYRLYDDRATDQVRRRYEDALRVLDKIASGQVHLGVDASAQTTVPSSGPSFTKPKRVFGRDELGDYAP